MDNGAYQTITAPAEGLFKDKGSRFISFIYPVTSEEEVKSIIQHLKKEHHSARHHCYAWRIGTQSIIQRSNDDGEPSSTAGKPILGQLTSNQITNVLLVVVRYFGGTLLGVSGLINAYRQAAAEAINNARIVTCYQTKLFMISFDWQYMNQVMQTLKNENLNPTSVKTGNICLISLEVKISDEERVKQLLEKIPSVKIAS